MSDDTGTVRKAEAAAARGTVEHDGLGVVLAIVTLVQALATFTVLALPTVAPKAAETFGVAPQALGYQISVLYAAGAFASGFAGTIVRRYGAGSASLAAILLGGIGVLGLASGSLLVTTLATIVLGAAYGITNPAASHLLVKVTPAHRRNLVFAIKQAGVPLGGMLAALLLPPLSTVIGWQGAIAASSILFLLLIPKLVVLRPRWDSDRDANAPPSGSALAGIRTVAGNWNLMALSLLGFCYAGYQFTLLAFAVTLLVAELGWDIISAGLTVSAMQLAGVGGRIAWSLIADRSRRGLLVLAVIGVGSVLLGLGMMWMTPAWSAMAITAYLFAFAWCSVGWNGVYMAEAARTSGPQQAGLATGGLLAFNFSGVIVCPAAYAIVSKATGVYAATFAWFAVLPLIGLAAALLADRHERRLGTAMRQPA